MRVRIDRNELAGAFGDVGTSLPLLVGMIAAAGLDGGSVFALFGVLQIATGIAYGIPMPVQPLKAVAVLVITQRVAPGVIAGAGVAIGVAMLLLTATGATQWIARTVPRSVVRGLQLGLGLQLATLAVADYMPSDGMRGLGLALLSLIAIAMLLGNRRIPPALIVVALGAAYAFAFLVDARDVAGWIQPAIPILRVPSAGEIATGFLVLALPQVPLSLGNSLLATRQVAHDLYPERDVTVRGLGFTYAAMNLVAPWLGGVPVCHGSGGLAGHHAFGARTGGSPVIIGSVYVAAGLLFGAGASRLTSLFPLPALGALLVVEGIALARFSRELVPRRGELLLALAVALAAVALPYGYAVGMVIGTAVWHLVRTLRGRPLADAS